MSAWCIRTLVCSLPALMTPLLDQCLDNLSLVRSSTDALLGYGYACSALIGAVHACPLGIPHLKAKLSFNIGEELLRTASAQQNSLIALHKTSVGWLLLGAFMTMGTTLVRKHIPRMLKLWKHTMPASLNELETEKQRADSISWQILLEGRSGALASIHSFLTNCSDLINIDVNRTSVSKHRFISLLKLYFIIFFFDILSEVNRQRKGRPFCLA
jgi:HEAT repeat-containing protein 5